MRAGLTGMAMVALLAGPVAGPGAAQDWFTPGACTVARVQIDPVAYPPALEARMRAAAAGVPNPVGRLWRITAPGGQVSHLWGTMHSPDPAILDLPQALREVIEAARVVAIEFDPIPDSRDEARAAYASDWMWRPLGNAPDFREDLPPQVMDWIGLRLADIGWSPTNLPQMTDAGVLSLLLWDPCSDYLAGVLPGQDYHIAGLGLLAGAEVTGLQEPEDLGRQLTDPGRAANARAAVALYGAYLGPESADPGGRATGQALYLQGRLAELDAWGSDWLAGLLGPVEAERIERLAEDYLLVERNGFFFAAARPLLEAGGAVIAVGASHLPGELGMVEMLRDAGYGVERVVLPGEPE